MVAAAAASTAACAVSVSAFVGAFSASISAAVGVARPAVAHAGIAAPPLVGGVGAVTDVPGVGAVAVGCAVSAVVGVVSAVAADGVVGEDVVVDFVVPVAWSRTSAVPSTISTVLAGYCLPTSVGSPVVAWDDVVAVVADAAVQLTHSRRRRAAVAGLLAVSVQGFVAVCVVAAAVVV